MEDIKVISSIDLKTYYRLTLRASFNKVIIIMMLCMFAYFQYLVFSTPRFSWNDELYTLEMFAAVWFFFFPGLLFLICYLSMKRVPYLSETLTYTIADDKIQVDGDSISNTTSWQYVKKLVERETYFLLGRTTGGFSYLPKQGFQSKEDMAGFKAIAKEKGIKFSYK